MGPAAERARPERARPEHVAYLDNLKVVLTAAVIVSHAAMTYGAEGTWKYEEPSLSDAVEGVLSAAIGVGVLFGLGLFFLIAGVLTTGPLERRGPRRFLLSRVRRLGLPLLLYAAVVWPLLQWWVDRPTGDSASLATSFRRQFSAGERWSLGTGPLWFVAILLVVSTGWSLWRWFRPAPVAAGREDLAVRHLVVASGTVAVATFLVRIPFPIDSAQFLDLHVWIWPQAAVLFGLGALGVERGWLPAVAASMRRRCRRVVAASAAGIVAMIPLSSGPDAFKGGLHWEAAGMALVEGAVSVSLSLLVLDRFRRRHDAQGRVARCLADAAYGAFVLQGPVLVGIALALRDVALDGDLKFLVLAASATALSFGLAALLPRGTRPRRRSSDGAGSIRRLGVRSRFS